MCVLATINGSGTLNTNRTILGLSLFVKQEVELNIPEVPIGSKLLCMVLKHTNPPTC